MKIIEAEKFNKKFQSREEISQILTVSRPHKSAGRCQKPQEECEIGLGDNENHPTDDERHGKRCETVAEDADRLEK